MRRTRKKIEKTEKMEELDNLLACDWVHSLEIEEAKLKVKQESEAVKSVKKQLSAILRKSKKND